MVDSSGSVLNHIVYDAFGNVSSQSNSSVVFRFGYTARELDAESGLQYNRARYFDPTVGRFISEDRIGFAGGDTNLYRYVFNSPVTRIDPNGFASRELSTLFGNSHFDRRNVLIYNTIFKSLTYAYAIGIAWFDAITISGPVGLPQKNDSSVIVFRALKDDTGISPPRAGNATLRPFSSSKPPAVTIDLKQDDDFGRTHSTSGYMYVDEVKFQYKNQDREPKTCRYFLNEHRNNEEEENARIQARNEVYNLISSTPRWILPELKIPEFNIPFFNPFGDIFKDRPI